MTQSNFIQRHLTDSKALSAALVIALVGQIALGSIAQAAVIADNKVGTEMTAFRLGNTATFSQTVSGQQAGAGSFSNGSVSDYPEGSCIPGLVKVKNKDNEAGDIVFSPSFDYLNGVVGIDHLEAVTSSLGSAVGTADDLSDLTLGLSDLSGVTSFTTLSGGTVSAVITGPVANGTNGGTQMRKYDVTLQNVPAGETVLFLTCARLGADASEFNGATLSMRLSGGNENIGISTTQLLVLPTLTIVKQVVGGDATADQWSFNVSPTINGQGTFQVPQGGDTIVIENVPVDGAYAITESGPAGYDVSAGAGSLNCTFNGAAATGTVAAGDTATDATCVFVNTYDAPPEPTSGTLTVIKTVINDDGGTAVASDFTMNITGTNVSSSSFPGSDTGTSVTLDAGSYSVAETAVAGYTASYSADCTGTIAAGETKTCTVTNDDNAVVVEEPTTGTLIVIKNVINDDAGTSAASDFTMNVSGTNVSTSSFPGSETGTNVTLDAGSYAVTEGDALGYAATYSADCTGTIAAGETKTCTITNDDYDFEIVIDPDGDDEIVVELSPSTLTVVKVVINDNGGTSVVSDFPLFIDQTQVVSGSSSDLQNGTYVVSETGSPDYVASFSGDCDVNGVVILGIDDQKTCTITNDDKANDPPGGGGSAPQTGTLIVVTNVINDDGGEALPASFTLTVGDGVSVSSTFGGYGTPGISFGYAQGVYVVNGSTSASYSQSKSANCSGAMLAGQTVTCVVTYDDIPTGGSPTPPPEEPPAPQPVPQVLGATDSAPVPQVLGATDSDLPVTGMPAWTLASVLLAAAPFLRRKRA